MCHVEGGIPSRSQPSDEAALTNKHKPSPRGTPSKPINCHKQPSPRPGRPAEDNGWYFTGKYHLAEQKNVKNVAEQAIAPDGIKIK